MYFDIHNNKFIISSEGSNTSDKTLYNVPFIFVEDYIQCKVHTCKLVPISGSEVFELILCSETFYRLAL